MKKLKILTKPTRYADLSSEDLYDNVSDWELKAERLRTRALRKFKHQTA